VKTGLSGLTDGRDGVLWRRLLFSRDLVEFVSGGPKHFAFSVFTRSTRSDTSDCKVKRITLNYENSMVVNFTTLKKMILDVETHVHVHNPKRSKEIMSASFVST